MIQTRIDQAAVGAATGTAGTATRAQQVAAAGSRRHSRPSCRPPRR